MVLAGALPLNASEVALAGIGGGKPV